ncbi:MAG: hypothetical protein Q4G63_12635 [Bacteroidia bacterium]|nr:hypothetical protein [Bacteroidia bacterium]
MKYIFISLLFILYGCNANAQKEVENNNVSSPTKTKSTLEATQPYYQQHAGVLLTTSQTTYSLKNEDIFEYSITNSENYLVLTGSVFALNYLDGKEWINYPFDGNFRHIEYITYRNGTKNYSYKLLSNFYVLNKKHPIIPGKYRIIKDVKIIPNEGDKEQNFEIYAEFTVVE